GPAERARLGQLGTSPPANPAGRHRPGDARDAAGSRRKTLHAGDGMTPESDGPHPSLPRERGREERGKARCPFCRSHAPEVISLFGSQVMTMQCKCPACGSFFEASKY